MKRQLLLFFTLILTISVDGLAQKKDSTTYASFILKAGLYHPAYPGYKTTFKTNSDLLWGVGINVGSNAVQMPVELSGFKTKYKNNDTLFSHSLTLINIGILFRSDLGNNFFLRNKASATLGIVKNNVIDEDTKKIGCAFSIGLDHSFWSDSKYFMELNYQYLRSREAVKFYDWGGISFNFGFIFPLLNSRNINH